MTDVESSGPRIVVVGSCASGKTTLVAALCARGHSASACAQEHSEIATLWNHTRPDLLVFLEADLATVRARRGPTWPETIYRAQLRRLASARAAADVIIDTARIPLEQSVAAVAETVRRWHPRDP